MHVKHLENYLLPWRVCSGWEYAIQWWLSEKNVRACCMCGLVPFTAFFLRSHVVCRVSYTHLCGFPPPRRLIDTPWHRYKMKFCWEMESNANAFSLMHNSFSTQFSARSHSTAVGKIQFCQVLLLHLCISVQQFNEIENIDVELHFNEDRWSCRWNVSNNRWRVSSVSRSHVMGKIESWTRIRAERCD